MKMEPEVRVQPSAEVVKDEPEIKEVINKVKSQGLFDQFRKECIADVDTKPAYHNLLQRVESYVEHFLQGQKWSLSANKNQLRETLRRQLHNSGMMQNGVERIIEQVVNPKILLGIKPKIDEAVCDHLGVDLKARQEEQQKRKQEQQRLLVQQLQQQQKLQSLQNPALNDDEAFKGGPPPTGSGPWMSGMANFPSSSVPGVPTPAAGVPGNPQTMGGNFPGMMPHFSMMGRWMPGFSPGVPQMMPGQPMIPAYSGANAASPVAGMGPGLPFNSSAPVTPGTSKPQVTSPQTSMAVTASTPVIPDLSKPPPGLLGTPTSTQSNLAPPGTARVAPAPPGSVPPPPGTVPILGPESSSTRANLPGKVNSIHSSSTIPALLSHTLAKVSQEDLTPEKIAVFKTAAAFITKTVNNAQGVQGADLAAIFSPRVLAEAMMEDFGKPMTKHEIRAAKRKERIKEIERKRVEREEKELSESGIKTPGEEDKENPLPPQHNLMDVFQGAEDVSDDEEALDLLMDMEENEPEDKHKQGVVLSDESDKEGDKPPTSQRGKRYNFAWDVDANSDDMSDMTVSSVHTSDMSSFEDEDEDDEDIQLEHEKDVTTEDRANETESKEAVPEEIATNKLTEGGEEVNHGEEAKGEEVEASDKGDKVGDRSAAEEVNEQQFGEEAGLPQSAQETGTEETTASQPDIPEQTLAKAEKPVDGEQLDVTKAKESVQPKPRKLIALSYNYSGSDDEETREERKARIAKEKEERYLKRQQRRAELDAKKKERDEERVRQRKEKQLLKENMSLVTEENKEESVTPQKDVLNMTSTSNEADSSAQASPKKRKNKAEMKEHLLQQKVMEKKAALRRKRTRNRRYASDEFTSIFSDHKKLNQSYTSDNVTPEEIVTFEGDGAVEIVEMTIDQECVVETVGEEVEANTADGDVSQSGDLVLQCPSPYSDISDRSMSERSEPENVSDPGMDEVSSDDELGDLEEVKIVEELEDSSKGQSSPNQSMSESDVGQPSDSLTPDLSRVSSTKSKSALSQDDVESVSSQFVDRRKTSDMMGTQDEDVESQASLMESLSSRSQGKPVSAGGVEGDEATSREEDLPPKDMMAELELEPVSDEGSSLDDCLDDPEVSMSDVDKEEGEEKDSDKDKKTRKEDSRRSFETDFKSFPETEIGRISKVEAENASDEGEIKSDSEEEEKKTEKEAEEKKKKEKEAEEKKKKEKEAEEVESEDNEEKRQRVAKRKPIHKVDFGMAEKRARETRVMYSGDNVDRRARSTVTTNPTTYRQGFNWSASGSTSQFGPKTSSRFMGHDPSSPIRTKSPSGNFDAESEASSHSRSSVRVRDDVPPPYPIEGVSTGRKYRSPASSSDNAVDFKPMSPPSPVSSSSSRHSRSRSKSRSRSLSSSSRSSSYSSDSAVLSRKRKRSKRMKKKKRRRVKPRSPDFPSPQLRQMTEEQHISPRKSPILPDLPAQVLTKDSCLSSGNESISSDELPYFQDEDSEAPPMPKMRRTGSRSSVGSSNASQRRQRKDSSGSISSSELIYSPTRTQQVAKDNNQSDSSSSSSRRASQDKKKTKRRRSSSVKSSQSSCDLPPVSPVQGLDTAVAYSPHRPSSPVTYPPLPDDMSGFQPPLPQEPIDLPPLPPLPSREQPPSPSARNPPEPPCEPPSHSEEEEGECLSPAARNPPEPPCEPPSHSEEEDGECPSSPESSGQPKTLPVIGSRQDESSVSTSGPRNSTEAEISYSGLVTCSLGERSRPTDSIHKLSPPSSESISRVSCAVTPSSPTDNTPPSNSNRDVTSQPSSTDSVSVHVNKADLPPHGGSSESVSEAETEKEVSELVKCEDASSRVDISENERSEKDLVSQKKKEAGEESKIAQLLSVTEGTESPSVQISSGLICPKSPSSDSSSKDNKTSIDSPQPKPDVFSSSTPNLPQNSQEVTNEAAEEAKGHSDQSSSSASQDVDKTEESKKCETGSVTACSLAESSGSLAYEDKPEEGKVLETRKRPASDLPDHSQSELGEKSPKRLKQSEDNS